jgi:hypothetical protein
MLRRFSVTVAFALAILAFPLAISAAVVPYYGFNYLAPNIPSPAAQQCPPAHPAGVACSGWNNWDRHRVYKNSGDFIHIAFQGPDGTPYYCGGPFAGTGTFVILRVDCGSAPPYNRGFCQYHSGNSSYVKCEMIIF